MTNKIIFDNNISKDILDIFDKTVNDEGKIVEKYDTTQLVLTPDGEEVNINEFAGIKKGSEIFIKSDLISLLRLSKQR